MYLPEGWPHLTTNLPGPITIGVGAQEDFDFGRARAALEQGAKAHDRDALMMLGQLEDFLGKPSEAAEHYRHVRDPATRWLRLALDVAIKGTA